MKVDDLLASSGSMIPSRAQHSQQQWLAALELAQRDARLSSARAPAAAAPDPAAAAAGSTLTALRASPLAANESPIQRLQTGVAPTLNGVASAASGAAALPISALRGAQPGSLPLASAPAAPAAPAERPRAELAAPGAEPAAQPVDAMLGSTVEPQQGALAAWVESLDWAPQVAHASVVNQQLHVSIRDPGLQDTSLERLLRQIRSQADRWGLGLGAVTVNGRVLAGDPGARDGRT